MRGSQPSPRHASQYTDLAELASSTSGAKILKYISAVAGIVTTNPVQ